MLELLQTASKLKAAPTGEPILPTIRLALITIIIDGSGESVEINAAEFCPRIGVAHVKSLPRILKQLAEMGLITLAQGRDKRGHKAAPVCYPLPSIKRNPSNLQAPPSNPEVTRDFPSNPQVTKLSAGARKDLEPPSNPEVTRERGTVLAFISPSQLQSNSREGGIREPSNPEVTRLLEHPAVRVWLEIIGENISIDTAAFISKRVDVLPVWRETLEGWKATPNWNNQNVAGQMERYQKNAKSYVPPPAKPKEKDPELEARIKKFMYRD